MRTCRTLPSTDIPAFGIQDAGEAGRTAALALLARLPRTTALLLPRLPSRWSAALLLHWLRRHGRALDDGLAWTVQPLPAQAGGACLSLASDALGAGLPGALAASNFHAAALEQLFRRLVHPGARVAAVHCARGQPCRFDLRWPLS